MIPLPETNPERWLMTERSELRVTLANGEQTTCQCCGQVAKVYPRALTEVMVRVLKALVEHGGMTPREITSKANPSGSGDYAKLFHWGLAEPHPDKRWRATAEGRRFAYGHSWVPLRVLLYNNIKIDFDSSEMVHVDQLGGRIHGVDLGELFDPETVTNAEVRTSL